MLVALALTGCWFEEEGPDLPPLPPPDCDRDGDGYESRECGGPDCDDNDMVRYPGNVEFCDGVLHTGTGAANHDEDCNPCTIAMASRSDGDSDHDGYISSSCSNPFDVTELYCNLHQVVVEPGARMVRGNDCDDAEPSVHAFQTEVCNHRDDNCDGDVDDGALTSGFADLDHDGEGTGAGIEACVGDVGFSIYATDCDDGNPAIRNGSIRCAPNTGVSAYQYCNAGAWVAGTCPLQATCRAQPNGTGVCI